jgi:peroxiredoxin Q/BCP
MFRVHLVAYLTLATVCTATQLPAQFISIGQAPQASTSVSTAAVHSGGPNVGDVAPDFTFSGATRYGLLRDAMKLSDLRGQTVVLAFFPGARTPGCTIQMEKYRDMYATLFNNGANVVVLGVSVDPDTALASWAHDAHFPMLFTSDAGGSRGTIGMLYGAYDTTYKLEHRLLYVIGPDGKVAYVAKPFDVSKTDSYTGLGSAIQKTLGPTR